MVGWRSLLDYFNVYGEAASVFDLSFPKFTKYYDWWYTSWLIPDWMKW